MPSYFYCDPQFSSNHLSPEDSRHAIKVLRLAKGDEIQLTDGVGQQFRATISNPDPKKCQFQIDNTIVVPRRNFSICIGIAPTKNIDRIEWLVEKCTEIGVESVYFVRCTTSERKNILLERLQKIAISALKQSKQAWLPKLHPIVPLENVFGLSADQKFIATVDDKNPVNLEAVARPGQGTLILIGPEGDFTPEEIQLALTHQFVKVSLGPNTLRTETAGLAAVTILNSINRK